LFFKRSNELSFDNTISIKNQLYNNCIGFKTERSIARQATVLKGSAEAIAVLHVMNKVAHLIDQMCPEKEKGLGFDLSHIIAEVE
jgi:hypothetical protein